MTSQAVLDHRDAIYGVQPMNYYFELNTMAQKNRVLKIALYEQALNQGFKAPNKLESSCNIGCEVLDFMS